jgi:hypothetical protein
VQPDDKINSLKTMCWRFFAESTSLFGFINSLQHGPPAIDLKLWPTNSSGFFGRTLR